MKGCVSLLNLLERGLSKDIIRWWFSRYLDELDKAMVRVAHNSKIEIKEQLVVEATKKGYSKLVI